MRTATRTDDVRRRWRRAPPAPRRGCRGAAHGRRQPSPATGGAGSLRWCLELRPCVAQDRVKDLLDLVKLLLAADERRSKLDDRVTAVVGPTDQPGFEQLRGEEPAKQAL